MTVVDACHDGGSAAWQSASVAIRTICASCRSLSICMSIDLYFMTYFRIHTYTYIINI